MQILVLGAGAIGGYYGARRAAQLERDGLVVQTRGEERRQPARTLLAGQVDRPFDARRPGLQSLLLPSAHRSRRPGGRRGQARWCRC